MPVTVNERVITKAIRALNRHLPAERKTLAALMREDKPAVRGRDNSIQRIRKEEIERIASLIPEEAYQRLQIPIYIELTSDYGRGISRIRGKTECEVVRKILGLSSEQRQGQGCDEIFIYREDVRRLRRELQTTTQYAFVFTMDGNSQ